MNETVDISELSPVLTGTREVFDKALEGHELRIGAREVGTVIQVGKGIARIKGLPGVKSEELVRFPDGLLGMAFNLDVGEIGVVLLGHSDNLSAGADVYRTGRVLDVPVGDSLLGRVIDATGNVLDEGERIIASELLPIERAAPAIMDRDPVTVPLQTGIKSIDALIPIGRGQRELILGDRQTGKTAIILDTFINQKDKNVICIYCAIGQRSNAVANFISKLREHDVMEYCIVVVASGEDAPGLQYITPYAATTIGEYFMEQGRDVLIAYDDLTRHAQAYRELSLLLERPPGREAFPGDIFYIHSRLLERSTHLRMHLGGGSLTALPVIETEAQNVSAYIPTNLISITDGQIYLSPNLFQKGIMPAVDVGKSVSRVGGKTQFPSFRKVSSDLKLFYSQFEELETFARFGTRLDDDTQRTLERGRRVREILKQPQYKPIPASEQVAVLYAVARGEFDEIPMDKIAEAATLVRKALIDKLPDLAATIEDGGKPSDEVWRKLTETIRDTVKHLKESVTHADQ